MKPLLYLANIFIDSFGITKPKGDGENRAAQVIAGLIGFVVLIFLAFIGFGIYIMTRQ
ncbi:MAG TPA: hypothetical protein VGB69_00855 [Edaphobacter sp.]